MVKKNYNSRKRLRNRKSLRGGGSCQGWGAQNHFTILQNIHTENATTPDYPYEECNVKESQDTWVNVNGEKKFEDGKCVGAEGQTY